MMQNPEHRRGRRDEGFDDGGLTGAEDLIDQSPDLRGAAYFKLPRNLATVVLTATLAFACAQPVEAPAISTATPTIKPTARPTNQPGFFEGVGQAGAEPIQTPTEENVVEVHTATPKPTETSVPTFTPTLTETPKPTTTETPIATETPSVPEGADAEETKEVGEWTGMPEFEVVDEKNWGLEINERKTDLLWETMLNSIAAGELFRVVEGLTDIREVGVVDMSVITAEYQRFNQDKYKWQPSSLYLEQVEIYKEYLETVLDGNNGVLAGVYLPWVDWNKSNGFTTEDIDFKQVVFSLNGPRNQQTIYGAILQGRNYPAGGARVSVTDEGNLLVEIMAPKLVNGSTVGYITSYGLESIVTSQEDFSAFDRVYRTRQSVYDGDNEKYGFVQNALFNDRVPTDNMFVSGR